MTVHLHDAVMSFLFWLERRIDGWIEGREEGREEGEEGGRKEKLLK